MRHVLVALALALCPSGAIAAESFYYRGKPVEMAPRLPDAVAFPEKSDADLGEVVLSTVVSLVGGSAIPVSVAGGDYRTCVQSTCADRDPGGWTQADGNVPSGSYVQLRTTAPSTPGAKEVSLAYGGRTTAWRVTSIGPTIVAFGSMEEASFGGFRAKCGSWGPVWCLLPLLNFEGTSWFPNDPRRGSWFVPSGGSRHYEFPKIWCHVMTRSTQWGGRFGGVGDKGHSLRIADDFGPGSETLSAFGHSGVGYIEDRVQGVGAEFGCRAWAGD